MKDKNPIGDVLFCIVWVAVFFAGVWIACEHNEKQKQRPKPSVQRRIYLDEPSVTQEKPKFEFRQVSN